MPKPRPTTMILNPGSSERLPDGIIGPFARAVFDPSMNCTSVYLYYRGPTGTIYVQSAPTVAPCAAVLPGTEFDRNFPFIRLDKAEAGSLMDSLWDAGVRPTASRDRVETLAAKDAHIKTLEGVVDRLFKIVYPGIPLGKVREENLPNPTGSDPEEREAV